MIIPIGQEPADLKEKMDKLFSKINAAHPDKILVQFGKNHEKWASRASKIGHELGYATGTEFLTAYGYTMVAKKGGRPTSVDTNLIIEELKSRYPTGPEFSQLKDLIAANPDFAAKYKTMQNSSQEKYGMPLSDYFVQIGLLKPSGTPLPTEDAFNAMLATASQWQKESTTRALKRAHEDFDFIAFELYLRKVLGKDPSAYYEELNLVQTAAEKAAAKAAEEAKREARRRELEMRKHDPRFIYSKAGYISKYVGSEEVLHIPEGVTAFNPKAFVGHNELREIYFPSTLEEIPAKAFKELHGLEHVHFSEGLFEISDSAFENCPRLQDVDLPDGVVLLGRFAFADCKHLERVHLPGTIRNPADRVFAWCDGLKEVVLDEGITQISEYMFTPEDSKHDKLKTLRLPTTLRVIAADAFAHRKAFQAYLSPDLDVSTAQRLNSIFHHGSGMSVYKVTYEDGKLLFYHI